MSLEQPPLASGRLDRDAATRATPELLRAAWDDSEALVLRLRGAEVPVTVGEDGSVRLALVSAAGPFMPVVAGQRAGHVYVGRLRAAPVFAISVEEATVAALTDDGTELAQQPGETWLHPFAVARELSDAEREVLVVASALLRWHEGEQFSPRDGSATVPTFGGWARQDEHGGELFPRTDPAVIVMIEHEDRILLGSNALWETGRFSLLAGFVEAGESLEQAVIREMYEEAGVRLEQLCYVASQPWPFPRSLMVGFRARLATGFDPNDVVPDVEEISELRWFSRDELRSPEPGLHLPRPLSIARWMIDRWIAEGGRVEYTGEC